MNLKVKIKKEYKEGLEKKWTWKKNKDYELVSECCLCDRYRIYIYNEGIKIYCNECPFHKYYNNKHYAGCLNWIEKIDDEFNLTNPTKKEFTRFINKAKKYIEFY